MLGNSSEPSKPSDGSASRKAGRRGYRLLDRKIGERSEALGGIVLIGVGIAIATGLL
jgi:hypothetical protein